MFAIIVHEKGGAERREVFDAAELSVGRVQGNELDAAKGNVSKRPIDRRQAGRIDPTSVMASSK